MVLKQGQLFDEYEEFKDKFKPKKTTDDCYTPIEVYECVKQWVNDNIMDLTGKKVERPFKPGGDYVKEMEGYDENTVVVDNPPFSILAEIKNTYGRNGVKYFLFAPHLTLFSGHTENVTYVITNITVTYENGAMVNTDFVTNMVTDGSGIIVDAALRTKIKECQQKARKDAKPVKPTYKYPKNVITSTSWDSIMLVNPTFRTSVPRNKMLKIRRLDSQIALKKAIFGGGI